MPNLPSGWSQFDGGGVDPNLCGDGTPLTLLLLGEDLSCEELLENFSTQLQASGGVPPYSWTTTDGRIEEDDPPANTLATLYIDELAITLQATDSVIIDNGEQSTFAICMGHVPAIIDRITYYDNNDDLECTKHGAYAVYNCYGELISRATCNDGAFNSCITNEDLILLNPPFRAHDYSQCGSYPTDWILTCQNIGSNGEDPECAGTGLNECGCVPFEQALYDAEDDCSRGVLLQAQCTGGETSTALSAVVTQAPVGRCDIRLDQVKTLGCAPCTLLQDEDIVVTVTDAAGNSTFQVIHIN